MAAEELGTGGGKREASRTLFVRNLPYSTSDDHLKSVFEKYGAIKSCFTVKDKGIIDRCKGYGYVLFEKREDANRAKSGVKKVKGRVVQVIFADKRPMKTSSRGKGEESEVQEGETTPPDESDDDSSSDYEALTARPTIAPPPPAKQRKPVSERREAKYDVGRVVVVTGVPQSVLKSKLRKKCSKYGPLENYVYPVATVEEGEEGVNGLIAHVTYKNYTDARKAAKALKGLKFGDGVKPLEAVLMSKEGKTVSKVTLTKSRLIVRNISFDVTSKDLQEVFCRYGDVREVHIPRKPNGHMRGFAFVQFTSYFDASQALEGVNGVELKGRPVAVDWVVPKTRYEASLQNTMATVTVSQDDEGGDSGVGDELEGGRGEEGGVKSDGDVSGESSAGEMEAVSEEEEEEEEERGEGEKKVFKADVHKGTTVFVRNLPLGSCEEELKELFSQYGRVRYARIVLDKVTGLSRGTAFVQFIHPVSLQTCLESCGGGEEQELMYNGRQLDVSLALSPRELAEMMERGMEKEDKRNLYLSKEGNIQAGTEAASGLTKTELAKRLKAQAEKKAKLANPNFYVSRTRLSVRNLPTQTKEPQLREIINSAVNTGKITQLKILRSKDRVDAEGVGRSKGFAFVEFSTHEAALAALRATNNNPNIFTGKRLIVEFAVEDVRIMRARELRKRRLTSKNNVVGVQQGGQISRDREGPQGTNKKVKWQLKCKEKRLRKREAKRQNVDSGTKDRDQRNTAVGVSGNGGSVRGGGTREVCGAKLGQETRGEKGGSSQRGQQRKRERDSSCGSGVSGAVKKRRVSAGGDDVGGGDGRKHSKRPSRKARKGGAEQREEKAFSDILESYRRKLSLFQQ